MIQAVQEWPDLHDESNGNCKERDAMAVAWPWLMMNGCEGNYVWVKVKPSMPVNTPSPAQAHAHMSFCLDGLALLCLQLAW